MKTVIRIEYPEDGIGMFTTYLKNGFENLESTIQKIKSTLENYKKAFFNSSMYVKA